MIHFIKDVYITGYTILFRFSRSKDAVNKAGLAVAMVTLIEGVNLINISSCIEVLAGGKLFPRFSELAMVVAFFVLFFMNQYVLYTRGYGVRFEREFDHLKQPRKTLLVTSCILVLLATIAFSIYSTLAYRRFISTHA
jgi:hypothetical protein